MGVKVDLGGGEEKELPPPPLDAAGDTSKYRDQFHKSFRSCSASRTCGARRIPSSGLAPRAQTRLKLRAFWDRSAEKTPAPVRLRAGPAGPGTLRAWTRGYGTALRQASARVEGAFAPDRR